MSEEVKNRLVSRLEELRDRELKICHKSLKFSSILDIVRAIPEFLAHIREVLDVIREVIEVIHSISNQDSSR